MKMKEQSGRRRSEGNKYKWGFRGFKGFNTYVQALNQGKVHGERTWSTESRGFISQWFAHLSFNTDEDEEDILKFNKAWI